MSHQGRDALRVLFWRGACPTSSQLSLAPCYLDKAPSLSRNAEFGALKALSVADNGGSLYCRRAGRRNFYRHAFRRLHRRSKVFDNRRRDAKMFPTPSTRAPSVFFPPVSTSPALDRGSNRRSPSAAVLGALANHFPPRSPFTRRRRYSHHSNYDFRKPLNNHAERLTTPPPSPS